jgi:hypothetical protein
VSEPTRSPIAPKRDGDAGISFGRPPPHVAAIRPWSPRRWEVGRIAIVEVDPTLNAFVYSVDPLDLDTTVRPPTPVPTKAGGVRPVKALVTSFGSSGKKIPTAQAASFVATARRIRAVLSR